VTDVLLEPEQERLLVTLVEAARSLPSDKREQFWFTPTMNRPHRVQHPGLAGGAIDPYPGDWQALAAEGLLRVTPTGTRGYLHIDVTPRGFQHYSRVKARSGKPVEVMELDIRHYLDSDAFKNHYHAAWEKWTRAEELLWSADSAQQLTNIGHLCRETVQEFADALAKEHLPRDVQPERTKTIARVRAVLERLDERLGRTSSEMLQALVAYWGAVMNSIQRQEHGSQREGGELTWEDARRVVFQTAVVMFEVHRALRKQ
jgi:hypothetical protein